MKGKMEFVLAKFGPYVGVKDGDCPTIAAACLTLVGLAGDCLLPSWNGEDFKDVAEKILQEARDLILSGRTAKMPEAVFFTDGKISLCGEVVSLACGCYAIVIKPAVSGSAIEEEEFLAVCHRVQKEYKRLTDLVKEALKARCED